MQLRPTRFVSAFVDNRIVHAPLRVVWSVLREHLEQRGFDPGPGILSDGASHLPGQAVQDGPSWLLLVRRRPKVVRFQLDALDAHSTQVRLEAGYGVGAEAALALLSLIFWAAVWWGWTLLVPIRQEFQSGGRLAHFGILAPTLGLAALWMLSFTWLWFTAWRPLRFPVDFYLHLSGEVGLGHTADAPAWMTWPAFLQIIIIDGWLLAIVLSFRPFLPALDLGCLLGFLFWGLATIALFLLIGPGVARWIVGQAAFTTGIALSLYFLFPMILWALASDELPGPDSPDTGSLFAFLSMGAALTLVGALWVFWRATADADRLVKVVDYWREHPENHRWSGSWARRALCLAVLPAFLLTGGLVLLSFWHSLLFAQSRLLGSYAMPHAVLFDQAAGFIGTFIARAARAVGLDVSALAAGRGFLLLYVSPILFWGACHLAAFLQDLGRNLSLWRLPSLPAEALLHQELRQMARTSGLRVPRLRIDPTSALMAYAVIAPVLLLPRLIVVSRGAIDRLPHRCLVALLAHEVGHLRHGHTLFYNGLRLLSRILLLGPSFLTGLIQSPVMLEAEADGFAVAWLESHGRSRRDLVEALRAIERDQTASLLSRGLREGVAISGGADSDWLPARMRQWLDDPVPAGFALRMVHRWRLLHYMTFHSDLANYTYTSLSERLEGIAAFPHSARP